MSSPSLAMFFALIGAKAPLPAARKAAEALDRDLQALPGEAPLESPEATFEALVQGNASTTAARNVAEALRHNLETKRRQRRRRLPPLDS